jgi:hypothetical protein|tara:strand:+ start:577 stop:930 length:354 start_codon:yes stop_codon:yes gene_type:complete
MEEVTSDRVQEDNISAKTPVAKPKKVAAKKSVTKKATVKRKATTAKSKRRKTAARPSAPPPPPLTLDELKQQGREAKQEVINAVIEPALLAAGSLSQTIRDTIGGTLAGLLSRKRRN